MMRVAAILVATLVLATSAGAQSNTHSDIVPAPTSDCAMQLAQTLAAMEARPLMKEEQATALMWLRLTPQTQPLMVMRPPASNIWQSSNRCWDRQSQTSRGGRTVCCAPAEAVQA